jgi:SAM-dependent methyltransferase
MNWGKILLGTRLEKTVSATFLQSWTNLVMKGLRPGDGVAIEAGKVAHRASNGLVRQLLKSECDTLLMLDSDANVSPDFVERFRSVEAGKDYDLLQAFYVRRGWPPEAIWFRWAGEPGGDMMKMFVTEPNFTEEVAAIGTHAVLIRRQVFEKLLGDNSPDDHDWFYYPRGGTTTEDVQFSLDAGAAGFKLGATTNVTAPHLAEVTTGWDTYQNYLEVSGQKMLLARYEQLGRLIADFTGEAVQDVIGKAMRGGENVRLAWDAAQPNTAAAVKAFYGAADNGYLYDLLAWNCTQSYQEVITPLYAMRGKYALVIGAGLGVEVDALLQSGNRVDLIELPGVLRDFCISRFAERDVSFLSHNGASKKDSYDLIVAVDVLEHIHPDEIGDMLADIYNALTPGGILHCHNNWKQQDLYPMHFDHSAVWTAFVKGKFEQIGAYQWRKL